MELKKALTKEWTEFNGNYEKLMQDIKLFNGDIITKCWPNAGYWLICQKEDNDKYDLKGKININDIEYVRNTQLDKW